MRSRAGSGDARLDEVHGDVDIARGSGEMSIGLPSGVGEDHAAAPVGAITVRARTGSGDVRLFRAA